MVKIKLLFLIDTLGGGGAEKVLVHILRQIDRSLFMPALFVAIKGGVYFSEIPSDIPVYSIFRDSDAIRPVFLRLFYRLYRRSMLELFKLFPFLLAIRSGINGQYDVGVSFCEGHNTPLLRLKADCFARKIAWIHVDLRTHVCVLNKKQLYRAFGAADQLFFVSEDARRGFAALYPDHNISKGTEVVYNPIDVYAIRDAVKGNKKPEQNTVTLLSIGRLTHQKRFDKLLNVHRRLLDKGIDHRVCILGEGELRGRLEAQARQLGIEATCTLPGFQNPYVQLDNADVFVSTSDYEGLPVVVCEAMALAKPIVCTNISGSRELLENGKYGMLVENNEQAIEKGLEEMIVHAERRRAYSRVLEENKDNFLFSGGMKTIENKLKSEK